MAEWYQGYSPDTTDKDATRLFETKYGYPPLTLTRYRKSALLVGPIIGDEEKNIPTVSEDGKAKPPVIVGRGNG